MTAPPIDRRRAGASAARPARPHLSRRTRLGYLLIVAVMALWSVIGVSYVRALVAPGYGSFADKTSGWLRDHGAGPVVDRVESWYYTRTTPSRRPADPRQFGFGVSALGASIPLPNLPLPVGVSSTPRWRPVSTLPDGTPAIYTSSFEPDPSRPSVVAGVAVMSAAATTMHLMTGTTQPRSPLNHSGSRVPSRDLARLAAVFNSGFRLGDIIGGIYDSGHLYKALIVGQATAAIDDRGHLTVGQWGRDLMMGPHLVAARQNLALVVDAGRVLPKRGVSSASWGGTHLQYQYTWRSGLGIDRSNNIVYVAGDHLDLATLAAALVDAGVVRGMQLDLHSGMSAFMSWTVHSSGVRAPTKLLSSMPGPATRYLTSDRRDFFYVTIRSGTVPAVPQVSAKPGE